MKPGRIKVDGRRSSGLRRGVSEVFCADEQWRENAR